MSQLHVDLVCRSHGAETDAIRDHTMLLRDALDARPATTAQAHDLRELGDNHDLAAPLADQPGDVRHVVLLQYNPYSFARRGMGLWLPSAVRRLHRARPRAQIALLVHELWVPMDSVRHIPVGLQQRIVYAQLRAAMDVVLVSTDSLVRSARRLDRRPVGVLPSGSNLPDGRLERQSMRRRLGIGEDQPVVAAFGMNHPSRLLSHLRCAIAALAEQNPNVVILNLGASAPPMEDRGPRGPVLTPGLISADELARYLASADLLLLPLSDGVATRRTTLMAGLQHGVPILGTDGPSTSAELRSSDAMALVASGAPPRAYAKGACELLGDAAERRRLGGAARALYERRFAWPRIAAQFVDLVERGARPR